jgi:hypothetical protein
LWLSTIASPATTAITPTTYSNGRLLMSAVTVPTVAYLFVNMDSETTME